MGNQVYVVSCTDYAKAETALRKTVERMGGISRFVQPGERILL